MILAAVWVGVVARDLVAFVGVGSGWGGRRDIGLCVGFTVGFVVGSRGTIQRPVLWHFRPVIITSSLYVTLTLALLKVTSQPLSHRITTDINEWEARPGIICPLRAALGSPGIFRVHLCVDWTLLPSGRLTFIPSVVASLVSTWALVIIKLLVAPESKIAHLCTLAFVRVIAPSSAFTATERPCVRHWSW